MDAGKRDGPGPTPSRTAAPPTPAARANQHPRAAPAGSRALPRAAGAGQFPRPQPPPNLSNGHGLQAPELGARSEGRRGPLALPGPLGPAEVGALRARGPGRRWKGAAFLVLIGSGEGFPSRSALSPRPAPPAADPITRPALRGGPRGSLPAASSGMKPPPPVKSRGGMCGKARRDAQRRPWPRDKRCMGGRGRKALPTRSLRALTPLSETRTHGAIRPSAPRRPCAL